LKGKDWVNPIFTDFKEINRSKLKDIEEKNKKKAEDELAQ